MIEVVSRTEVAIQPDVKAVLVQERGIRLWGYGKTWDEAERKAEDKLNAVIRQYGSEIH
ncbi:hypothetical protein [Neptuniibacter sp. QD37_11]|uniref:hypothetical protein n=1 Tax=Neptuniibacter sp. QD37_11 TaxID=3398209 RepID=UPI0039F4D9C7